MSLQARCSVCCSVRSLRDVKLPSLAAPLEPERARVDTALCDRLGKGFRETVQRLANGQCALTVGGTVSAPLSLYAILLCRV